MPIINKFYDLLVADLDSTTEAEILEQQVERIFRQFMRNVDNLSAPELIAMARSIYMDAWVTFILTRDIAVVDTTLSLMEELKGVVEDPAEAGTISFKDTIPGHSEFWRRVHNKSGIK